MIYFCVVRLFAVWQMRRGICGTGRLFRFDVFGNRIGLAKNFCLIAASTFCIDRKI
ncbi:MAG: hypothetical protein LBT09_03880 [Planctomycetaceae bacterium]|nr:hypothetical protein [Planctomycetaceae bacterium]